MATTPEACCNEQRTSRRSTDPKNRGTQNTANSKAAQSGFAPGQGVCNNSIVRMMVKSTTLVLRQKDMVWPGNLTTNAEQ